MDWVAALQERFATWALRSRPPEPTPIVLSQRRVYVLPTRAGLAFAVAQLVMLLGAINYNLSLGHALVFLLAGLFIVAILHTFRNLVGLRIDCGRADSVFAGETAHFMLLLDNPGTVPRRRIQLTTRAGGRDDIDLPPHSRGEACLGIVALRRGWLALPRVTLETRFPLGIIRTWSYAAPAMRCLVYPQPAGDATLPVFGAGPAGARMQERTGNEDFAGLRRYQPSDPPRHIAWKAAARRDPSAPLLAKQFSGAGAEILWLDWDDTPATDDVERRLSILARWVLDADGAGMVWGLRLPGARVAPGIGDAHLHAGLKALALHETP